MHGADYSIDHQSAILLSNVNFSLSFHLTIIHVLKSFILKKITHTFMLRIMCLQPSTFVYYVSRWVATLQPARVTRWGGMISTPDAVLQAVIKRALIDSGCPSHIVTDLMENAHERRWPPGLSTLETRQLNRRQYENYITKKIPGRSK